MAFEHAARLQSASCRFFTFFALLFSVAIAGCGGGAGISVTLSPSSAQTIDQAQTVAITATVANDSTGKGVTFNLTGPGTLASQTATSVTYDAPASVATAQTATITATSVTDTSKTMVLTISVNPPPSITTASLPAGLVGTAYNQTIAETGGAGTLAYTVSVGSLPVGLSSSGSGAITGTPTTTGTANFTVKVTDSSTAGAQSATKALSITINQAAVITSANATTFTVSSAGTFAVTATGSPTPSLSETGALPTGVTFVDNGNGTATLAGTPAVGTANNYPITITAHNGAAADATQSFTLTVGQAPAITSLAATTFTVGTAGTFSVSTTGFPLSTLSESGALPSGVTFTSNANGTATLAGTPAAGTGGTYTITIKAHNGIGADATQSFTLTVHQAPAITSANSTTFTVATLGTFSVTATGSPTPSISETGALPTGVTFVDNGNGTATLAGTAATGTQGSYPISITTSNGVGANATQSFTLTVSTPAVVTSANATAFTVGTAGTFSVTTTGFPVPSLNETGTLPNGVTFTDNGNGTATLAGTSAAGTGGTYPITIKAQNAGGNNSESFTLTVDQAPAITSGNSTSFSVGGVGTFTVTTSGFPKPALSETGVLPTGVTFIDNGNGTGTLGGTPATGTSGSYPISFTANNGVGTNATQSFTLTVNTAPSITSANATTFTVGSVGTFTVTTTGNPIPSLSVTGTLPGGVTFTDNGNGTGTLAGTPGANTGGTFSVTIKAQNTLGSNSQTFTLTVDQAPGFTSANSTTFTVGTFASYTVLTSGFPKPGLSETGALPTGVTFVDNGNGTATLSGTPATGTANTYPLTITANNGIGTNATQSFTLTVNTAPVFSSGTSTNFTVGAAGTFTVTASGSPSFTETGALPAGVTLTDNGNGTATLGGTPAANAGGTYNVTIKATNGAGSTSQGFTLTVNQSPSINSNNAATFILGQAGSFSVNASGFPSPSLSETGSLPTGVTFVDNGNGNATLSGTPATGTANTYPLTITASNGIGSNATQSFTLTVISDPCITAGTGSESLLNGQYAFLLKGFDNGQGTGETQPEPAIVGGVLTFNGSGTISTGTLDQNLNSTGGVSSQTVSGTYKVGSDHRACMDITTSLGTQHYRESLANISAGAASTGHMIDFDASGPFTSGVMKKQTTSAFSTSQVTGNFAFELASPQNTASSSGGNQGVAGVVKLSSGTVTGGELDFNDEGTLEGNNALSAWPGTAGFAINSGGTLTINATSGRGALSFAIPMGGSSVTVNDTVYVVSASDFFVLTNFDQTQTGGLFAGGEALKQSGTFSSGSLNGNLVIRISSLNSNCPTCIPAVPPSSNTTIGAVTSNGSGSVTAGTLWQINPGSTPAIQSQSAVGVTYTTPDADGRALLSTGGGHSPLVYLVSTNEAFVLGASQGVETGMFEPQMSTSAPSGAFAFGTIDPQDASADSNSGVATFSSGSVSGTSDNNSGGQLQAGQTFSNMNVSVDSTGLGEVSGTSSACTIATGSNPCQLIFYIISPTRAVLMNTANGGGGTPSNPSLQIADQ